MCLASIEPGNQECNGILALLAKAPPNKDKAIIVIAVYACSHRLGKIIINKGLKNDSRAS